MKFITWIRTNPTFVIVILIAVIIAVWMYRPIEDTVEIDRIKQENARIQSEYDRLDVDYGKLLDEYIILEDIIESGNIKWEKNEKDLKHINNKDVPNTRDDVISWDIPSQLEFWENKRAYTEGWEE